MRICWISVLVLISISLAAPLSFADAPFFTGLGDLTGGDTESIAYAISSNGLAVVGASCSTQSGTRREAFCWAQGSMMGLGDLPGGNFRSNALDVSTDGSVIVGDATTSDTPHTAARWDAGVLTDLGALTPNGYSQAWGVSGDGLVIVGESDSPAGHEAFRWSAATGMTSIGASSNSIATATSANGSIVVGAGVDPGAREAFRWENGNLEGLGFLAQGQDSIAYDISSDGSVIVGYSGTTPSGDGRAFRWKNGTMLALGELSAGGGSSARGVSSDGSTIVGTAADQGLLVPFIWDESNGMRNLQDMLENDLGIDLAGWTLTGASDVSADGKTIIGTGRNSLGETEGWIAHIPEPNTALLSLVGGLLLMRKRVRSTISS